MEQQQAAELDTTNLIMQGQMFNRRTHSFPWFCTKSYNLWTKNTLVNKYQFTDKYKLKLEKDNLHGQLKKLEKLQLGMQSKWETSFNGIKRTSTLITVLY